MKKVAIIYNQLYDCTGNYIKSGGIETYLLNLSKLLSELNYSVTLFQASSVHFKKYIENLEVIGIPVAGLKRKHIIHELYKIACKWIDRKNDIIIFGSDNFSLPTKYKKCISIQHGVYWDLPIKYYTEKGGIKGQIISSYRKFMFSNYTALKDFNNCYNRVCVDYNYLNWYRTACIRELKGNIWVIPNFLEKSLEQDLVIKKHNSENNNIKIIFARRFEKIRGTGIIIDAVKSICAKYRDVSFTFAGEGKDEEWLKLNLINCNVSFTKYNYSDAIRVHMDHHIAIIPSIACEGTSFSVIEAMGAGCAIVATATGGITNLIIDDYNGLLILPNSLSLIKSLEKLILNRNLRIKLAINGHNIATQAFNIRKWRDRWQEVIGEVGKN